MFLKQKKPTKKTLLLEKLFQKIKEGFLNSFYVARISLIPKTFSATEKRENEDCRH